MYELSIYLAGEIHSDWRNRFRTALEELGIDADILGPGEDHSRSDDIGEDIPGKQPDERYRDPRSLLKKYRDHWDGVLRVLVRRSLTKYSGPCYRHHGVRF